MSRRKKIAIIGTGIAGMVAAYKLNRDHDISVFEANDYIGGHTHTHDIELDGRHYAVDSGFIVFNDWTYPNFIRLLDELGVASQPSAMSFSVKCERSGLEYNGTSLNTLFAQRRNLLRPAFYHMIRDILRFNREAPAVLHQQQDDDLTLGEYLAMEEYSTGFIDHYIIPMGAAIWSTDPSRMLEFPARYFVRFLHNHGMLSVNERPEWRVIKGGSARYIESLTAPYRDRIQLNNAIESIKRYPTHVEVKAIGHEIQRFDAVFIASHSDQALRMLVDASKQERDILGAIPYQANDAVLHTDTSLLPKRRRAWAAWNYHRLARRSDRVALTYNMNILQGLSAPQTLCVTLNHSDAIDPARIIKRIQYHHPFYTPAGVAAQRRHNEINGVQRTFYCGAYWRFGFHEDGVVSALKAYEHFKEWLEHEQLSIRRTA